MLVPNPFLWFGEDGFVFSTLQNKNPIKFIKFHVVFPTKWLKMKLCDHHEEEYIDS